MGTFRVIPKEIKEEILGKIKNDGLIVSQAAKDYSINNRTIYGWLKKTAINNPSILEIAKLKRENRELKEIIGAVTHELHRHKKNQNG